MTPAHQEFLCSSIWVRVVVPSTFLLAAPPLGANRRGLRRSLVSPFLGSIISCNRKKGILLSRGLH